MRSGKLFFLLVIISSKALASDFQYYPFEWQLGEVYQTFMQLADSKTGPDFTHPGIDLGTEAGTYVRAMDRSCVLSVHYEYYDPSTGADGGGNGVTLACYDKDYGAQLEIEYPYGWYPGGWTVVDDFYFDTYDSDASKFYATDDPDCAPNLLLTQGPNPWNYSTIYHLDWDVPSGWSGGCNYRITLYDAAGHSKQYQERVLYVSISDFYAIGGNAQATVSWNVSVLYNSSGLDLYRSTVKDYSTAQKVNATRIYADHTGLYTYTDTGLGNNTTYWYWIREYDRSGYATLYGPTFATPSNPTPSVEFRSMSLSADTTRATFHWSVHAYSCGGKATTYFQVQESSGGSYQDMSIFYPNQNGEYEFIDYGVEKDSTYYFRLKEVFSGGSVTHGPLSVVAKVNLAPSVVQISPPDGTTGLDIYGIQYRVVATDPDGDDVRFHIQVDTEPSMSGQMVWNMWQPMVGSDTTYGWSCFAPVSSGNDVIFRIDGSPGDTYYWRVRAMDPYGSGQWGPWSGVRSLTTFSERIPPVISISDFPDPFTPDGDGVD
ncbi:MAG: hypothetical protein QME66_12315 [Candidatus Eisenbacteria bacterium]|nr:hypothetical protein [Candidatus Eisenbacteria bacterium]